VNTPKRPKKQPYTSKMIRSVNKNSNTLFLFQINHVCGCECPKNRFPYNPNTNPRLGPECWTRNSRDSAAIGQCMYLHRLNLRRDGFETSTCTSTHQATRAYDTLPRSYISPYHRPCIHPTRSTRCTLSARGCVAVMI
jgi:hypothetical protein